VPKERIEGTHKPTNAPSSLFPVNHNPTENKNDTPAATTKPIFANFVFTMRRSLLKKG
jgi:hypothetical protein